MPDVATSRFTGAPPAYPLQRLTVDDYHTLIEAGRLTPEDRVELLNGFLVEQMSEGEQHAASSADIHERLAFAIRDGGRADLRVLSRKPVVIPDYDEPEPDVAVVRRAYRERGGKPTASDAVLLIEVSDTSLRKDRTEKLRAYEAGRVPEYWIVNVREGQVEVYRRTESSGEAAGARPFEAPEILEPGAVVGIEAVPEAGMCAVEELLGEAPT